VAERIVVVVTTYDREDALDAVLRSLSRQSDRGFEVVVADDGSGPATATLVESWKDRLGAPLSHVWHAHRGFRAGEIRNRAVIASRADYIVFLDGDCLVRPDFIAAHRRLAEPGFFVTGNRVLLSAELTRTILDDRLEAEAWGLARWACWRLRGGVNRLGAMLHLPLGPLRKLRKTAWQGARSCNLALWRADFERVDGFDAAFSGWGKEDSDLLARLIHSGVRRKEGIFATGVVHLWHPPADRERLEENERMLDAVIAEGRVRAREGLSTLVTERP